MKKNFGHKWKKSLSNDQDFQGKYVPMMTIIDFKTETPTQEWPQSIVNQLSSRNNIFAEQSRGNL